MPTVVALDLPRGPPFLEALRRVWDAGDTAAPLDPRLPPGPARDLLAALRPGALIGPDGDRRTLEGGLPSEPGDALLVATSGSTGLPRGVLLSHAAVEASARATSARLAVDSDRDRWLACLPLAHIGGLSVVTRALLTGTPVEIHPGMDPPAVEAAARDRGATLVSLVTAAVRKIDPSLFRLILLGGAAPPADPPPNAIATYGMTETGSGIVYDGLPLEGVELAMGDGHGSGAEGEILIRAPMLLRCYRDGTDPRLPGGWFPTGDAGALDPTGRLTVAGRIAEVIVTGGEKVWPAAVEALLAGLRGPTGRPTLAEVAVAGVPDPDWGQLVVAYAVPADPADPPTLGGLREALVEELPGWAAPRRLVLLGALPRLPGGKLDRSRLAPGPSALE